jgi:hypothetical protein
MSNDPPEQAVPRQSVESAFEGLMLAFSARGPASQGCEVSALAATTLDGKPVLSIGFDERGATRFTLLLDATTFQPRAVVRVFTDPHIEGIQRQGDYREVSGIRLPVRLELTLAERRHITTVRRAAINPPLTPADFARRR